MSIASSVQGVTLATALAWSVVGCGEGTSTSGVGGEGGSGGTGGAGGVVNPVAQLNEHPPYFALGNLDRSQLFCGIDEFTSLPDEDGKGGYEASMDASKYFFADQKICIPGSANGPENPLLINFDAVANGESIFEVGYFSMYGNGDDTKSKPGLALDIEAVAGRQIISVAVLKSSNLNDAKEECPSFSGDRPAGIPEAPEDGGGFLRGPIGNAAQEGDEWYNPLREAPQDQDHFGVLFNAFTNPNPPTIAQTKFLPAIDDKHRAFGACQEGFIEVLLAPHGAMHTHLHVEGVGGLTYDPNADMSVIANRPQCEFGGYYQGYSWAEGKGLPVVPVDGSNQGVKATDILCIRSYESNIKTLNIQEAIPAQTILDAGEVTFFQEHDQTNPNYPFFVVVKEGPVDPTERKKYLSSLTFRAATKQ